MSESDVRERYADEIMREVVKVGEPLPGEGQDWLLPLLARYRDEVLEEAARPIHAKADVLYEWMDKEPLHSRGRKERSLRAGENYEAARAIRALKATP